MYIHEYIIFDKYYIVRHNYIKNVQKIKLWTYFVDLRVKNVVAPDTGFEPVTK